MTTKTLTKKITNLEKRLGLIERHLLCVTPPLATRYQQPDGLEEMLRDTAGALKNKLPKNSVAWQKKMRAEWSK